MRPFWGNLNQGVNTNGRSDSTTLIDTDAEQPDQLEFSTLGEKPPIRAFAELATRVEVDSEGFTSQDAGHVTHQQYDTTQVDNLG